MFFFSSRRRHTRLQGDWSSDVCSSDLKSHAAAALRGPPGASVERHTQPKLYDVLLPPRKGCSETVLVYISYSAVQVVHHRRERNVSADADVVSHAAGEPPTRAVEGRARIDVIVGESEAAGEE